jgi:hypothetical protein
MAAVAHAPLVQPTLRPGPLGVKPMLQVAGQALPLAVLMPVQLHSAYSGRNAALGVPVQAAWGNGVCMTC